MANAITALNPEQWKTSIQDYLNKMLIATEICNTKCEAFLSSGDQVNFPYVSDARVQSYTQGTDLTIDDMTATADSLSVDQSKAVTFVMDPVQEKQAIADYGSKQSYQAAFQLRNIIDQTVLETGVDAIGNSITGGALTTGTILSKMNSAYAALGRANATDAEMFAVIDHERAALLTQTFVANGFTEADSTLRNQFRGRAAGFNVFVSNNLPVSQDLTLVTIPTASDTMEIAGITFTWVAAASASAAGDISIGANITASKANFLLMIAGTATGSAATYVDVSAEDRKTMQNMQLEATAFAAVTANLSTLTAFGKIGMTEDITPADAVVGTETGTLLFGRMGAISLAIQMKPELYIREEPKQISRNYITHALFGTTVFHRDEKRLAGVTYNV